MIIARVVGNVVATQKHQTHEGKKILLIQPLDLEIRSRVYSAPFRHRFAQAPRCAVPGMTR